ncbi:hypothetical protein, partial [Streptosporangium carneum]
RQPPDDDGRHVWPPERRPRGGQHRASPWGTAERETGRGRRGPGELADAWTDGPAKDPADDSTGGSTGTSSDPVDDGRPDRASKGSVDGGGPRRVPEGLVDGGDRPDSVSEGSVEGGDRPGRVPEGGDRSGWVSEGPADDDRREWTSEEFRGEDHRRWAVWGRVGRRGRSSAKPRRDEDQIWPEESVWEVHRPWPLNDDAPQDELPPSARWYGAPAAPPPRKAAGRLRRLLVGLVAAVAGLTIGYGVAVFVPPLLLEQVPHRQASASGPARVDDPVAGVGYPLPAGWRVGAVAPVTGFTSMAGGDGKVTVMTGPADPVTDARKRAAELADLYGRLLLHGDEVKVVDDRAVTVGGRTGHSRSLRAEYRDVVNRPAYLKLVLLTGQGRRPVVVVGVSQPDDPRLRAAIDTVIAGIR